MKVVEPTPAQAALVLKKFFASNGMDIKASLAQEAIARTRGYDSFNTLASQVPSRVKQSHRAQISQFVAPYSNFEGMQLWVITGRMSGDDDDSCYQKWATSQGDAETQVKAALWEEDGNDLVDWKEEHQDIYIITSTRIGAIQAGNFVLAGDCQPPTAVTKAEACCKKCDSALTKLGYCSDETCPYSDWPQAVRGHDLHTQETWFIERKYKVSKRKPNIA